MGGALARIEGATRSPWARILAAASGLAIVYAVLRHAGWQAVSDAMARASHAFPLVVALEAGIIGCTMCALRMLYAEDRHRIPLGALLRAGVLGYAWAGLLPAGRTFGESLRATILTPYSSAARAWAAAFRLQGITLLANCAISLVTLAGMVSLLGAAVPTYLVAANAAITGLLGAGVLLAGSHSKLGARLGRRLPRASNFGAQFDQQFARSGGLVWRAFGFEFLGRVLQLIQYGLLLAAVGGAVGVLPALCSEAIHLVGAALGDLIPAQLGATEAGFELSARALDLRPSEAISIALVAHLAQLVWISAGLLMDGLASVERLGWRKANAG